MNEGDDTLTESCEGAISFMVIEISFRSWQKLPFGDVIKYGRVVGWVAPVGTTIRYFVFYQKDWGIS